MPDVLALARAQFALTAMFHIIWPVLTIGLSLFLVVTEALWIKTRDPDYYRHARFWSKLFILNFGVGVVTGVPLEFEFGANWAPFSAAMGDFFGNILGFEGAMAFMLEAGFLGIMLFGWRRVAPKIHLFATCMVAAGASMSAFWIIVANSWMQTPAGGVMQNGRFVVQSYFDAMFNPAALWGVGHMWFACLETSLLVIGGLSAWYIYRGRHTAFFLKSFKIAVAAAILVAPLQIFLGDGSGTTVFKYQPAKGAAIEGFWHTNPPGVAAPWAIVAWPDKARQRNDWAIEIPGVLSLLATHSLTGQVQGLADIPRQDQPPALPLLFYTFRLMVAIGFFVFGLMLWSVWLWRRGALTPGEVERHRWWLRAWIFAVPLGYIAVEAGWIVREVGRQPWVVHGIMRTEQAVSSLAPGTVLASLLGYVVLYTLLVIAFLTFARHVLRQGPDIKAEPPPLNPAAPLRVEAVMPDNPED
ncbi:MAG: cytochrome ubiquinol oxidase subunit I [Gammaproteobacteria bacterium]|nr:cytochrome ubiquinol oxidase subunit I [Gammaproteobacteria bacterium]